jgi:secondary thiamine-phosphate synthase enzyme
MMIQKEFKLSPYKRGYHLITREVLSNLPELPERGILHLFIKHTSAALTLNENADSSVRTDFETVFNKLVPENESYYSHVLEGSDDLPAHIKSSLIGSFVTIPITGRRLNLGTWQGIYLCEFRNNGGNRSIVATIIA